LNGADLHAKSNDGVTPLHTAAFGGKVEALTLLLEHGADLHAKSKAGFTPLHDAAYGGKVEVLTLMLEYGADLHAKSNGGVTPLHSAVSAGMVEALTLLLERGADVPAQTITARRRFTAQKRKDIFMWILCSWDKAPTDIAGDTRRQTEWI
jgi:ankyrin repeat protein